MVAGVLDSVISKASAQAEVPAAPEPAGPVEEAAAPPAAEEAPAPVEEAAAPVEEAAAPLEEAAAPVEEAVSKCEPFVGKWLCTDSEDMGPFLKLKGVPWIGRKAAGKAPGLNKETITVTIEGANLIESINFGDGAFDFKPATTVHPIVGEVDGVEVPDNVPAMCKYYWSEDGIYTTEVVPKKDKGYTLRETRVVEGDKWVNTIHCTSTKKKGKDGAFLCTKTVRTYTKQ